MPENVPSTLVDKHFALPILGPVIADFATWMLNRGYAMATLRSHLRRAPSIDRDLHQVGVRSTAQITHDALEACVQREALDGGAQSTIRAIRRFLCESRALAQSRRPVRNYKDAVIAEYGQYLTDVRGLVAATVAGHIGTASRFLAGIDEGAVAVRLSTLSPSDIEVFVRAAGHSYGRDTLAHVVAQLRSFLRFLSIQGLAPSGLDRHVDSPRTYRRDRLAKSLPWQTVRGLLEAVDQRTVIGLRDYAMLLLIATYGLRCCEVAGLKLDDLQWRAKRIRVYQRKTGSVLFLPLTDEAGTVLERYLRKARPPSPRREVFLRIRPPTGALRPTAISCSFSRWARRSGLEIPYKGAHCLRHSYAVDLLRRGTPLKAIGDILGHRLAESTCMYLGLALEDLRQVALEVPGTEAAKQGGDQA
jgi:site-specific recombinase XerD